MHTTSPSPGTATASSAQARTSRNPAVTAAVGPILLALCWVLVGHLPHSPLWIAVTRVLPGGLILLMLRPAWPAGCWWHRSIILGLINFGGFFTLQAVAVQHIPVGIAATIAATQVLLVPLGAVLLLNTPLRSSHLLYATTGILGVALLALRGHDHLDPVGIGAAVGTALCGTLGLLLTHRWSHPDGVHHLTATGWQMTAGGLFLLPAAVITEGIVPPFTAPALAMAAAAMVSTTVAFGVLFGAVHAGLPPTTISRLMLLCPVTVTAAGWLLYQHTLTALQLLGAVLVLLPVAAACRSEATGRHHRQPQGHRDQTDDPVPIDRSSHQGDSAGG
jgi:probable blue pigment (indigoidine) exporter